MLDGANILLTGGSGFLGSVVTKQFLDAGAHIFNIRSGDYDLRDRAAAFDAFSASTAEFGAEPDIVVHMASRVGGIGATAQHPAQFMRDNLLINTNVVDATSRFGVKKLIGIGSVCAYPKEVRMPMVERDLFKGFPEETNAPYGESKRALLCLQQAYRKEYGLGGTHLLMANMYGPGDNYNPETSHVIPALIRKMGSAITDPDTGLVVWGTGNATRDFLFVEDAADAILMAARNPTWNRPEPINIGTGQDVSIGWLVTELAGIMGYDGEIVFDKSRPDGQPRRCLDVSFATSLGWQAKTGLHDGLKKMLEDLG
jgi:nucleoside-diphosphate-sugar epimerase